MRILIFGAGAVGRVLAAMLSPHNELDIAARDPKLSLIEREGIFVHGAADRKIWPGTKPQGIYDIVIIATKAFDIIRASESVNEFIDENSTIVSPQNGLSHVDILTDYFGHKVILAPTTIGATSTGPNSARLVSLGMTFIGSSSGDMDREKTVAKLFDHAELPNNISNNIIGEVWTKAIVNACINPIAALAGVPNGTLLERNSLLTIAEKACYEAAEAAIVNHIELTHIDVFEWVKEVMRSTSENRCSMLQDLESGRRTEIDEINGVLIKKGESNGISMDVNRALWTMIRTAEGRRLP
ncbi:MAG: ketopantoate reductase family protein [Euryarchaeota archaeon]|nr:ketopantoate reductase family protein [Euryarchaeota archaeon]